MKAVDATTESQLKPLTEPSHSCDGYGVILFKACWLGSFSTEPDVYLAHGSSLCPVFCFFVDSYLFKLILG